MLTYARDAGNRSLEPAAEQAAKSWLLEMKAQDYVCAWILAVEPKRPLLAATSLHSTFSKWKYKIFEAKSKYLGREIRYVIGGEKSDATKLNIGYNAVTSSKMHFPNTNTKI